MIIHMYLHKILWIVTGIVFIFCVIVAPHSAFGQQLILETDKPNYEYGEVIELRTTIKNESDSTFTYEGSSSCFIMFTRFNDFEFDPVCTSDWWYFELSPGKMRQDVWKLDPAELGLPDVEGTQIIHVSAPWGLNDSIQFEAPKFYGGLIKIGFEDDISESEIEAFADSLNRSEVYGEGSTGNINFEIWKISGFSIDSLAQAYHDDSRVKIIEAHRDYPFNEWKVITSSDPEPDKPERYSLQQNHPNPFNPMTDIEYVIPEAINVQLHIYDTMGRRLTTLVDDYKQAGTYQVTWEATNLASGIYFYRLSAGNFIQTRQMTLVK